MELGGAQHCLVCMMLMKHPTLGTWPACTYACNAGNTYMWNLSGEALNKGTWGTGNRLGLAGITDFGALIFVWQCKPLRFVCEVLGVAPRVDGVMYSFFLAGCAIMRGMPSVIGPSTVGHPRVIPIVKRQTKLEKEHRCFKIVTVSKSVFNVSLYFKCFQLKLWPYLKISIFTGSIVKWRLFTVVYDDMMKWFYITILVQINIKRFLSAACC